MTNRQLRHLRTRVLGLTQAALAARLGVRPMTVARWEWGLSPISGPAAAALALLPRPPRDARGNPSRPAPPPGRDHRGRFSRTAGGER